MTALRERLRWLRDEHRAARYPGDLSADVLGRTTPHERPHRPWAWRTALGAALAVAAAVTVVVVRHPASPVPGPAATPPGQRLALGRPIPLDPAGRLGDGVNGMNRLAPDHMPLSFPPRPAVPVGLTLAPSFTAASVAAPAAQPAVVPPYQEFRMPSLSAFPARGQSPNPLDPTGKAYDSRTTPGSWSKPPRAAPAGPAKRRTTPATLETSPQTRTPQIPDPPQEAA